MKLLLVRHARTSAAVGLCYGRTDVAVPAEATLALAERIAAELPADIALVSSPLQRCAALVHAIAVLRPDLSLHIDPRLAEMDFGAWEERSWTAIDRAEFDRWMADFADARAGGTGESTRQFMLRVGSAFYGWRGGGRDALWVTHAGVIRAVWLMQQGVRCAERADQWPTRSIAFGECVSVELP